MHISVRYFHRDSRKTVWERIFYSDVLYATWFITAPRVCRYEVNDPVKTEFETCVAKRNGRFFFFCRRLRDVKIWSLQAGVLKNAASDGCLPPDSSDPDFNVVLEGARYNGERYENKRKSVICLEIVLPLENVERIKRHMFKSAVFGLCFTQLFIPCLHYLEHRWVFVSHCTTIMIPDEDAFESFNLLNSEARLVSGTARFALSLGMSGNWKSS